MFKEAAGRVQNSKSGQRRTSSLGQPLLLYLCTAPSRKGTKEQLCASTYYYDTAVAVYILLLLLSLLASHDKT